MKHVIIVGGGISGLAAAYYLRNYAKITLIEKSNRLGGWIRTRVVDNFLFECGPRGFRPAGKGVKTVELAKELGLKPIAASSAAKTRFIAREGKLVAVKLPLLLRSGLIGGLLRDLRTRPTPLDDETIHDFCSRHFGKRLTQTLMDPLSRGIFGGNYTQLSARSCFPTLWEADQCKGSILRGRKKGPKPPAGLFSFADGMESLIRALAKTEMEVLLNTEVLSVQKEGVTTSVGEKAADAIILTTPPHTLSRYFLIPDPHTYATIATVSLGWNDPLLSRPGYGFLVPSTERESVMGMTFDSAIFPEQSGTTRLCTMIGREDTEENLLQSARQAVARYCHIFKAPDVTSIFVAKQAIAQYAPGHHTWVKELENTLPSNVYALGSGLRGVGVNDCVWDAAEVAGSLVSKWQSSQGN